MESQTTVLSWETIEPLLVLESASVGRVGLIVSDLRRSLDFYDRGSARSS